MPEAGVLGVGLDLEESAALDHLDSASLRRAADRWLSAPERAWCAGQASLAEALVVVLCCKEAAFKAWNGRRAAHQVRLDLNGAAGAGTGRALEGPVTIRVRWRRRGGQIVALAVAHAPESSPG